MEDLSKIDSRRLYQLLKNVVLGLLLIVLTMSLGKMLPEYLSPVLSLGCIIYLYIEVTKSRSEGSDSCNYTSYCIFLALVVYTIISVTLSVLEAIDDIPATFPREVVFQNSPYVPSLIMMPTCAVVCIIMRFRQGKSRVCRNCRDRYGYDIERGRLGLILRHESEFQVKNLSILFTVLSIAVWCYYLFVYIDVNQNGKDWYIFTWLVVIGIILDQIYFIFRYYNLYLDLYENNQIISMEEMSENVHKTYIRVYVICGNKLYVQDHLKGKYDKSHNHIDTPMVVSLPTHDVTDRDVEQQIKKHLEIEGGELKLFYKREYSEYLNQNMNRYFYFLDGKPEDYPQLNKPDRRWLSLADIREIYKSDTRIFKRMFTADISRLVTIILTAKTYDEVGERRINLPSYRPAVELSEIRNSPIDFNSNHWIYISSNNSDSARWKIEKFFHRIFKKKNLNNTSLWL